MTLNQDTVLRYMDGFRKTDREQILACLTDDVVWKIPGAFETNGKAAFSGHIVDEGFKSRPDIRIARLVEGEDVVVTEGTFELSERITRSFIWLFATSSTCAMAKSRS